jgi:ADP-ribose pyrophosphatase YjhB (NUDIX family)
MSVSVVIGLSAVIVAVQGEEAVILTVRPHDSRTSRASTLAGLPFGPFDPQGRRTFELALRSFVTEQTRFDLGYVEQLYTFGDMGRDAPLADVGAGAARVISVGYLALTPQAIDTNAPDTAWAPWNRFFPWEDWRRGRPAGIDEVIGPALTRWAGRDAERLARVRLLFALDGAPWNEERVLERYELLYEAGLAPEAARDRHRSNGRACPWRADDLRPPAHPGDWPRAPSRQAQIPARGVRAHAARVHPVAPSKDGGSHLWRAPSQAELSPLGGTHGACRGPRPLRRRYRRAASRAVPLPPRTPEREAGQRP